MEEKVKGAEIIIQAHDRRIDPSLFECFCNPCIISASFFAMMWQQSGEASAKRAEAAKAKPKAKAKSTKRQVKTASDETGGDSVFANLQVEDDTAEKETEETPTAEETPVAG